MKIDGWWLGLGAAAAVVAGVFVYQGQGEDWDGMGAPAADRARQCAALSGEADARLGACLDELRAPTISQEARETLENIADGGKLLAVGPQPQGGGDWVALADHAEVRTALLGVDGRLASRALRDAGVRGIVVHRDLVGALDRDARVISRLAQHDYLEWFQLRYVTDEVLIYTVRSSAAVLPLETGARLLEGLRARLDGSPVIRRQEWTPNNIRLIGTLRLQGSSLAMRHAVGDDVEAVLNDLAAKLKRRWERELTPMGFGRLRDRLPDIRMEVQVVMERAPVEPRSRFAIFDLWEMGVDGMMFRQREGVKDDRFTYLPGSEATTRSIRSPDAFLRAATEEGGWKDSRPWEQDPRTRLDIIRTAHFMEERPGGGAAVALFRGMPVETMEDVTDDSIRQMLVDGGGWWLTNQRADGSFNYKYWPVQNRASAEYNEVRHILATRDLADTWRYKHDDAYLAGAVKAMDWLEQFEVRSEDPRDDRLPHPADGSLLFRYPFRDTAKKPANQKLGTVAVALLGWVAWAEATGDHSEDDRIRRMGRFVLSMKEKSGKFEPYLVPFGHPYYGQKNDIVPGEAALALGKVSQYFGEPEWLSFMPDFLDYYEPWFHERAKRNLPTGRWPHNSYANDDRLDLVQFGPWSVMATQQYYRLTGDARAAKFGLEIADWMIDWYQWSGERSPWPDYVGGYYKLPDELPAMQTFCYSEGTAAAYAIASKYAPERKDKYDTSTREAIRFLRVMQFDETDSYFAAEPDIIHGGIKYAMNENKIRIDYVGHGLSTLSQYLDAKGEDPAAGLQFTPWEQLAQEAARQAVVLDVEESGGEENHDDEE